MKKLLNTKIALSLYNLGGVLLLVLCLASCNNFLKADQVKNDIEAAIAYANAPSYTITVDYPGVSGVIKAPVGAQAVKKVTDTFALTFDAFADYEFICWKIINSADNKEIKNGDYLLIEAVDLSSTNCSVVKDPEPGMKLCICAVVAERPQVISYTPTGSNIIKDSSIQVVFDYEMNPYSIYFTDDEYKELKNDQEVSQILETTLENGTKRYYGYEKGGNLYFKNLTIIDNKSKDNLLANFLAPYFDDNNTVLIITTNKNNPPADFSQVLVNIGKGFYYTQKYSEKGKKDICLAGTEKWMYKVNNKTDKNALKMKQTGTGSNIHDDFEAKLGTKTITPQNAYPAALTSEQFTNMNYLGRETNDTILALKFTVQEDDIYESGPDTEFKIFVKKVFDESYKSPESDSAVWSKTLNYTTVDPSEASYDDTINIKDIIESETIPEGVYEISFEFKDKAGNPSYYPGTKKLYFTQDTKNTASSPLSLIICEGVRKFKFKWTKPSALGVLDVKETSISCEKHLLHTSVLAEPGSTELEKTYTFPEDALYDIVLSHTDYNGNISTEKILFRSDCVFQTSDNRPVKISGEDNKCKFGNFPQSSAGSGITFTSSKVYENKWLLGSDGYLYEKVNGAYFKVEPVIWDIIDIKTSQGKTTNRLMSEKILNINIPYYEDYSSNTITDRMDPDFTTIYPNDYEYSLVRAYLNGLSYYSVQGDDKWYKVDTYENHGLLQSLFSASERESIIIAKYSVNTYRKQKNALNVSQTFRELNDKLLLAKDVSSIGSQYLKKQCTDYTEWSNTAVNDSWWVMNPVLKNNKYIYDQFVDANGGYRNNTVEVNNRNLGIVPVIYIEGTIN